MAKKKKGRRRIRGYLTIDDKGFDVCVVCALRDVGLDPCSREQAFAWCSGFTLSLEMTGYIDLAGHLTSHLMEGWERLVKEHDKYHQAGGTNGR